MKSTGIIRKVDELGRVVLPIELRRVLGIEERDALEIYTNGDEIILKKYVVANECVITGEISKDNIALADGKIILSQSAAQQLIKEIEEKSSKLQVASY